MTTLLRWLRRMLSKAHKRDSPSFSSFSRNASSTSETVKEGRQSRFSLKWPLSSLFLSKKIAHKDNDEWTTIYLDEDSDWFDDTDDSVELRPVLDSKRPPLLPKFVKASPGVTDLRKVYLSQLEKESHGRSRGEGERTTLEDVPLAKLDRSSHLIQVAGLIIPEEDYVDLDEEEDSINEEGPLVNSSASGSDLSIISLMQRKYEKRVKRRLKYEALQELSARVRQRLQRWDAASSTPSYSSLTSEGGDFELNLPQKFYRKIGFTGKKEDERRRSRAFPFMKAVMKDLQTHRKDPAMYLMGKWLGNKMEKKLPAHDEIQI